MQERQAIRPQHSSQILTRHQALYASKLDQHHQKRHGHPRNHGQNGPPAQKRSNSQRSRGKPLRFAAMLACLSNSQLCLDMVSVCGAWSISPFNMPQQQASRKPKQRSNWSAWEWWANDCFRAVHLLPGHNVYTNGWRHTELGGWIHCGLASVALSCRFTSQFSLTECYLVHGWLKQLTMQLTKLKGLRGVFVRHLFGHFTWWSHAKLRHLPTKNASEFNRWPLWEPARKAGARGRPLCAPTTTTQSFRRNGHEHLHGDRRPVNFTSLLRMNLLLLWAVNMFK